MQFLLLIPLAPDWVDDAGVAELEDTLRGVRPVAGVDDGSDVVVDGSRYGVSPLPAVSSVTVVGGGVVDVGILYGTNPVGVPVGAGVVEVDSSIGIWPDVVVPVAVGVDPADVGVDPADVDGGGVPLGVDPGVVEGGAVVGGAPQIQTQDEDVETDEGVVVEDKGIGDTVSPVVDGVEDRGIGLEPPEDEGVGPKVVVLCLMVVVVDISIGIIPPDVVIDVCTVEDLTVVD